MRERLYRGIALAGVAAASILAATPVLAQEAQAESTFADGEIVVTATKRAESLQSVPISVTAIGGDTLAKSRVNSVDNLVTKVANLQLTSIVGDNTPIFSLRGVSMSDYSLNQSSPVATYYDEVYKGNFAFLGVAMYDLERVEVLRGPQGTLYGKNTTGGAVNIIAAPAKLGETSGYANAGYGNYNRIDLNGAINVPLGEKAALRIAGTFAKADGWFKNVLPGKPDLASTDEYAVRATLNVEASETVRFVLRASTSFQNPYNYGIYAQPEATNRPGLGQREIASNIDEKRRARTYSVALTSTFDVSDTLTVTSITAWDKGNLSFYEDTDGTASELLEIPYRDRATQFSQDLRLTSDSGGPFDFILGAFFHREKVFNETTFEIGKDIDSDGQPGITANDCAVGLPLGCLFRNQFDQVKHSYALYSDLKYDLTDALTLRGGLRFTHDTGRQTDFSSDALGVDESLVVNLIPLSALRYKQDNLSGKIGLDYKLAGGNLLYASVSRGYRAPSFNAQAFFDPSELSIARPEEVTSYEAGVKTQFMDRKITLNVSGFYYDYKNQQFINVDPTSAAQTLLNIPKSRIFGGEAELTIRASDRFTIHSGLGLLSTKIQRGTVSGNNVAGNKLSNAPSLTFNTTVDLTLFDSDMGKLSIHPDIAYQSSQFFEVLNVPRLEQPAYAIVGGHIDWESADGRFNASVWGKNLTDKFYFTSRVDLLAGFGFDYNHIGNPRMYGVSVGVKF
ncbi:MAG: TonB-dependent receptor [Novosphingobium sp. 28-62-57]|uniref:TonB-dependent receptor n=1 Tax=unclassified Novosphingobium TaxID=2644732 RepID=UPI000BC57D81|nr:MULTISPECIES: TonB-dependent receptor [unclassified Novosphingobium]OYW50006.1 MAG: TonB-dependent receptor [Novosphingobium sp. 12-62-10]OYZ12160.1 MAG: TonB-dependent receptor [Novosphingobium sp. 28-62-57]OZA39598.1 MAG: TonB-dependent receptor [Novosphingobium sp. 17-62-9]